MTFVAQAGFPVRYGHGISAGLGERIRKPTVVADSAVWAWFADGFGGSPVAVFEAEDLSPDALDQLASQLPPGSSVVGIGGGVAMDVAKWIHWRQQAPLFQIPTLPSVNACFTRMTALRDGGRVRYEGDAVPNEVIVDFDVFQSAPEPMVTAGIGDVLSCHTALFDWRLAVRRGHEPGWNDEAAGASQRYIDGLINAAPDIRARTDGGIQSMMELHREIGWRCHDLGHARFEEGSEHFFAYCFEEVTGRTILHGELVSLGVLILSSVQGNNTHIAQQIISESGTRHTPEQLSISWDEIDATLDRLHQFSIAGDYWYSIINDHFDASAAKELARAVVNF